MLLNLLTGKVGLLRVEDFSPTLKHLHLALAARGLTTAGTGQEYAVLVQRCHQVITLGYRYGTVAIYLNIHITTGTQILLSHQQDNHQKEYHNEENSYAIRNKFYHNSLDV